MSVENEESSMRKRRITLADGRYLIFYTFENKHAPPTSSEKETDEKMPGADPARPQAEEERLV